LGWHKGAVMQKKNKRETKDPLVGKYFHSVKADKETIQWQGK
jgi:hypothetical protein